eukprot:m.7849 g.7849  ORF g.7849 m.7849 type:complete len:494 (+) comp5109_c0_seq2:342-1823(+)
MARPLVSISGSAVLSCWGAAWINTGSSTGLGPLLRFVVVAINKLPRTTWTGSSIKVMAAGFVCLGNISPYATPTQVTQLVSLIGPSSILKLVADANATAEDPRFCFVQFSNAQDNSIALHLTNTNFLDRALAVSLVDEIPADYKEVGAAIAAPSELPAATNGDAGTPSAAVLEKKSLSTESLNPASIAESAAALVPAVTAVGTPGAVASPMSGVAAPSEGATPAAPPAAVSTAVPVASLPVDAVQCEHAVVFFNKRVVYVTNLTPSVSSDDLAKHFAKCGAIRNVRIVQNEEEKAFKYALVEFETEAGAASAVTHNGFKFGGRIIRVQFSKSTIMYPTRLVKANEELIKLRDAREKKEMEREKERLREREERQREREERERQRALEREERDKERQKEKEKKDKERAEREKEREKEKEKEREKDKEKRDSKKKSRSRHNSESDSDSDSASSASSSSSSSSDRERAHKKKKKSSERTRSRSRSPHRSSHKSRRRD